MDPIKENVEGKIIRLSSVNFDMSGNTELKYTFLKPDGVTTITKLKADGVVLGTVDVTVKVDGIEQTFLANKYLEYPTEAGVITPIGQWKVTISYIAVGKDLPGDVVNFEVIPQI